MSLIDLLSWWQWCIVIYLLISAILLRWPSLIYGRQSRDRHGPTYHGSHRGGLTERPENTLAAFEHALRVGTQLLELDVHLTADAQVVVAHDLDLQRTCGVGGKITSFKYADLPLFRPYSELKLPFPFHSPNQTLDWDPTPEEAADDKARRMPLLSEVLQLAHRVTKERRQRAVARGEDTKHIHIPVVSCDLKDGTHELADAAHKAIVECDAESFVVWGGFSHRLYPSLRSKYPYVSRFVPAMGFIKIILAYILCVLPFFPIQETYFMVGYFSDSQLARIQTNTYFLRHVWIVRVARWLLTRPLLVKHLQQRGIKVIYWVLNSDEDFHTAFKLGVDGVMTDSPSLLTNYLKTRQPELFNTLCIDQ